MRLKILSLVLVLIVSSSSLAMAIEIDLVYNNNAVSSAVFDRSKFFDKSLVVNNNTLHISVSGKNNISISSILLFLCKDKAPDACDFSNPIEYERFVETDFYLNDISNNNRANILTLVKAGESWIGAWDSIENGVWKTGETDNLNLYLKHDVGSDLKVAIESLGSIPTNSVEKADFSGKPLYILEGKKSIGLFKKDKINITSSFSSNKVDLKKGYTFVFPTGNQINNPITLFNTPELCGNLKCDIGETFNTCWQDCACSAGLVNTPHGCVPETDLKLNIESKNRGEFNCFIPPDIQAFQNIGGCVFTDDFEIKLKINNTPTTYLLNPPYFYLGGQSYPVAGRGTCTEIGDSYQIVENNFSSAPTIVYNASEFSCNLYFPPLERDEEFNETLAFSMIFPITTKEGNKTETHELTATTGLDISGTSLRLDLTDLQDLAKKKAELEKQHRELNKYQYWLSIAELTYEAVKIALDGCCASVIGSVFCCGAVTFWTPVVFGLHLANAAYGIYMDRKYDKKVDEVKEYAQGKVQESAIEAKIEIAQNIPNLVWVNGAKSGPYTGTVCGQENVEVWYNFESFGCSQRDGLWFNFNNVTRPQCDCQQFEWISENMEGPICDCNQVSTSFSWIKKDINGKETGMRKYNQKGAHLLLNTTADKLFKKNNILNITTFCSTGQIEAIAEEAGFSLGPDIGDVTAEFELVNYNSTCQ
ncbi:MAG: hypothetical protein HY512_00500 [Candidatus Aenigmarchaeota archaeon]|nr:hypothetical protein [Candidatus Aenigmarchaeota archaeon]